MRLPFLFQEFDAEAERTSLRILKGLGRFDGRDDISAQTITSVILNEGLRARLQSERTEDGEAEIALIRDALVEELSAKVVEEGSRAKAAEKNLRAKNEEIVELKDHLARIEESKKQRFALFVYLGLLTALILVAGLAAWQSDRIFPDQAKMIGTTPIKALTAIFVFVCGHLLLEWRVGRNGRMTQLWPFEQIRKFRAWLWAVVFVSFALGVIGNLYANRIEKEIDQASSAPSNSESRPSAVSSPDFKGEPDRK